MRTPGKHIAVFLQNKPYLGNQIALIPFFQSLREIHSRYGIVVCAHEDTAWALKSMGYIDHIVPKNPSERKRSFFSVLNELRKFTIDTAYTFRRHSIKAGLLARICATREVVGFSAKTTNLFLHRSVPYERNCYAAGNALALAGRQLSDFCFEACQETNKYFLIIPGGSLSQKKYPLMRYIDIAERLRAVAPVHFLLGKEMTEELRELSNKADRFVLHVARPLSQVEELVKQSAVVIANDCGPVHFAHIFDIRRVLIFGDTSRASNWYRSTRNSHLLAPPGGGDITSIDPQAVQEVAMSFFKK